MTEMKIALSIEEAVDYTGIDRNTLRKLVEWDKLPVLKLKPFSEWLGERYLSKRTFWNCL